MCKHENVFITEELFWKGYLEDGKYEAKLKENEITRITCDDCGKDFTQEEINKTEIDFD